MTEPVADVVELSPFRERREVRRAAAVAVVALAVLAGWWRAVNAWRDVETAIRAAAELLGDDDDVDA